MPAHPATEPLASHRPPHELACMEVWGGSVAFEGHVSVPGNDVRVSCVPFQDAHNGGDIYYLSNCAAGVISRFILADVSGHGEQVARIARDLRMQMRRHINSADQTRFAVALNAAFAGLDLKGKFATALLLTYFAPTDHLIVCNAGHPRPLWYRASLDRWQLLDAAAPGVISTPQRKGSEIGIANLPLGIVDPTDYEQFALLLGADDQIVLYTDAFIEACDTRGRQLGEEGLLALARRMSPSDRADIGAALRHAVARHTDGQPLDDDATIIVLHHNGGNPSRLGALGQFHRIAGMLGLHAIDSEPSV